MATRPSRLAREFPPVSMPDNGAPIDFPQYVPPHPHNLPPNRDRPAPRAFQSGVELIDAPPYSPGVLPMADEQAQIYDPHHYAEVTEGVVTLATGASAIVILRPGNRRNYLTLRNASPGTETIGISFQGNASANSPLLLQPGQTVLFDVVVPQGDVSAFGSAVTAVLAYGYSNIVG